MKMYASYVCILVFVSEIQIDTFWGNKLSQSTEFVLFRFDDFKKFRGINFREFGKKPRNFLPAKLTSIKVYLLNY